MGSLAVKRYLLQGPPAGDTWPVPGRIRVAAVHQTQQLGVLRTAQVLQPGLHLPVTVRILPPAAAASEASAGFDQVTRDAAQIQGVCVI